MWNLVCSATSIPPCARSGKRPYNPVFQPQPPFIMSAQIINGTLLSQQLRTDVARRAAALTAAGKQPGLAVILVGDSPASQVYVRNKIKACEDNGIHSVFEKYD